MHTKSAYDELGLDPSASDALVKATWRRLVATWHPDRNASADAGKRMQQINKAYQHIRQLRDGASEQPSGNDQPRSQSSTAADYDEPQADSAIRVHTQKVRITLEDAVLGCTRTLRGQFAHMCSSCVGTGHSVIAKRCTNCHGSGAVRKAALFGWLWSEESCIECGGDGRQRASCSICDGTGERTISYRRQVRLPAGVREGHVLSLPKSSHEGVEFSLELTLEIEPHPFFSLDAEGVLRCEMPVNGYAWMANRWVEVPTPEGMQQMRLSRDALVYRLRGQGFPNNPRGPRGDYLVRLIPIFPPSDDQAHDPLLDQLIASSTNKAELDRSHPIGQWGQKLRRWKSSRKSQSQKI